MTSSLSTKLTTAIFVLLIVHILWSIYFAYFSNTQLGNKVLVFAWVVSILVCIALLIVYSMSLKN